MQATIDINLKVRRDTTAAWAAANPILADGELGYDKTLKKLKIGDGVTAWAGLAFLTDEVGAAGGGGGAGGGMQVFNGSVTAVANNLTSLAHGLTNPVMVFPLVKLKQDINGWANGSEFALDVGEIRTYIEGGNILYKFNSGSFYLPSKLGGASQQFVYNTAFANNQLEVVLRVLGA